MRIRNCGERQRLKMRKRNWEETWAIKAEERMEVKREKSQEREE